MKTVVVLCVLAFGAWVSAGDQAAEEKHIKDTLQSLKDVTGLLKSIKDAKSAEESLAKLDDPVERLVIRLEALHALFDTGEAAELKGKYGKSLKEAQADLSSELERLGKDAEALRVLNTNKEWKGLISHIQASREGMVARAKREVKALESAVQNYVNKNGNYPEKLSMLAEKQPKGGAPLVKESALIDPWDRPYQYDNKDFNKFNGMPQIWSEGPDPKDPKGKISNWDNVKGFDKFK